MVKVEDGDMDIDGNQNSGEKTHLGWCKKNLGKIMG